MPLLRWMVCAVWLFFMAHGAMGFAQQNTPLSNTPGKVQEAAYAWVEFAPKPGPAGYDPILQLHPAAVFRRIQEGFPLNDPRDWPQPSAWKTRVNALADTCYGYSRWLNLALVRATPAQQRALQALPFVQAVAPVQPGEADLLSGPASAQAPLQTQFSVAEYQRYQRQVMEAERFTALDLNGRGVRIAVFDAGFKKMNERPGFAQLYQSGQIAATKNFVNPGNEVYEAHQHGTMVMSCIAGLHAETPLGLAPEATFLLARTEKPIGESPQEEFNWLRALEWADENGAHLVNSSLGYTGRRYRREQMDGQQAIVTRAAAEARARGILVINAAGNEFDSGWRYLGAPADAEQILTVGGINPETFLPSSFSSRGPTADGRLKPELVAPGTAAVIGKNGPTTANGTSFAAPLVTGFAACARQRFPHLSVLELKEKLTRAGHLFPYADYAHGYGVPKAGRLLQGLPAVPDTTFLLGVEPGILWFTGTDSANFETGHYAYLRYHSADGRLLNYRVYEVEEPDFQLIERPPRADADEAALQERSVAIEIYYRGYTYRYALD